MLTHVREMRDAGVDLLAGTDIPLRAVPGAALHMELGLLQSAGLSPAEALRTATINPARYLGGRDTLGTVSAGRVADLVLLRDNPLADVAAVEAIEMVFQRGRAYSRDDLDRLRGMARAALVTFRRAEDAARGRGAPR